MSTTVKYQYVNNHMDKYLFWHQLLMEQKIKVVYSGLATHVVARATISGTRREEEQLLTNEDMIMFVNNRKLIRNLAKAA